MSCCYISFLTFTFTSLILTVFLNEVPAQRLFKKKQIRENYSGPNYGSVKTENGLIFGTKNLTVGSSKTYYTFRGIPYAEPPIGELRFKAPLPVRPFKNGTLYAFNEGNQCVQKLNPVIGSEDCLKLNVYTPRLNSSDQLLPVMVFIHGGVFVRNNGSYVLNAPDYLLDNDVIVVTLNYRLGLFGFLSTGDLSLPGNLGLKDQVMALQWINKYIGLFGGNSRNVTLFGESAGAASISLHLQSTLSEGLFQGAIMESGTSLCLWSLSRSARRAAFDIGKQLNVNTSDSESLINGLRNVSFDKLQTVATFVEGTLFLLNPLHGLIFAPVIEPEHEGAFFTNNSHQLFSEGRFSKVPTIIGFNSMEAYADISVIIRSYVGIRFDLIVNTLVPIDLNIKSFIERTAVATKIKFHYAGLSPLLFAKQNSLLQFISDDQFYRPIRETVRQISKYSPVYFYQFSYKGNLGGENNAEGVTHSEELNYIFWKNITSISETDRLVRLRMTKLWTNFAKFGNPTPEKDPLLLNVTWPVARQSNNKDDLSYVNISNIFSIDVNPFSKNMKFWNTTYTKHGNPPYDTY